MRIRLLTVLAVFCSTVAVARAQPDMPKPGPEHEKFKHAVGDWEATVKMMGGETKAKATYKLDFGGFFLIEEFEGDFGGMKFKGRGQSAYCPIRKKYLMTWIDSMSPSPMFMTGTYSKDGKTLTSTGEGPDMEGKMAKFKSVTTMKDNDTMVMTMYQVRDGKDGEMMSIIYKRKK